jgi:hypothetical protein
LQTLKDPSLSATYLKNDRYLGYNTPLPGASAASGQPVSVGGVILFDGTGRTIHVQYGFRFFDPSQSSKQSALGQLLHYSGQDWPTNGNFVLTSQLGFVLYDRETFQNMFGTSTDPAGDHDGASNETTKEQWLDNNAGPILINRYNGTLIHAE